MDRSQLLPHLLVDRVRANPQAILIEEAQGRAQSGGEFLAATLAWASAFERIGVRRGQTVASILPNALEAYHNWIGLAWLPAIDVPVNEEYRNELLVHTLNDSQASTLVTVRDYLPPVLDVVDALAGLRRIVVVDDPMPAPHPRLGMIGGPEFLEDTAVTERRGPDPGDPFGIIYTSGTTGASKGLRGTWSLLASALAGTFPGDQRRDYPGGAYYSPWRSCHMTSKTALDFAVRLDFRVVLRQAFSISEFWSDIRQHGCTHCLVAFIAPWLWAVPPEPGDAANPLRRVAMVPLMPEFRQFEERFGVRVSTTWASSEAGWPLTTADPVDYRSCGRLVPGYHLRVVRQDGTQAAPGETGELLVRHDEPDRLFAGYHRMPEATAAAMRDGWYHTGDGFTADRDGNYYFVDRLKDYIRHRGHSIFASAVESYVCAHADVVECACIGVKCDDAAAADVLGDEDVKIVVVLRPESGLTPQTLVTELISAMPRFMVPRYVEFVDALPRNHVNKVAKAELRKDPVNAATWDRVTAGIALPRPERRTSAAARLMIPMQSAPERLRELAQHEPDDVLVRSLDSGADYTHKSMLDEALTWAAAFRSIGVERGTVVAVILPLSVECYFAWLGVAWLRGIEVPVSPGYRGQLLAHLLNSSKARIVVCHAQYLGQLSEIADEVPGINLVVVVDDGQVPDGLPWRIVRRGEFFRSAHPLRDLEPPGAAETAAVVYTSGTTGPSKGVVVPWRELSAYKPCFPAEAADRAFRLYSPWPTHHVNGKFALVETLNRHGMMVLRGRWRTEDFWNDVRANGITAAVIIGGASHFLWSQAPTERDADNPLEHILMAPVLPQFREFELRFGVKIHTGYASSEAGQPCYAFHPLPNHRTCGRLAPDYEIRLVDPDGNEVGPNMMGEALVRASDPNLMSHGYWQMPEATENAWRDGWFYSGDGLMCDEDGNYYYLDRVNDSLRRRGENISSWELESLANTCSAVAESAAIAVPGDLGDIDEEIMIIAVLRTGASLTAAQLVAHLQPRAPRFMIPRYIRFAEELPRTHTGRLRKVELRATGITPDTWDRMRPTSRFPGEPSVETRKEGRS